MEWHGDQARLNQICQLFEHASSPDNAVQQQVMQHLNLVSQWPDFLLYLATIFARLPGQHEVVRQRAGLLLKTSVTQTPSLAKDVGDYVQANALIAVRDPSRVIRHTAGTLITTIFQKVGVTGCSQMLDQLAELLRDGSQDVVEGSFNALGKICEDGVSLLKQLWDCPSEYTQPFVSWSSERLLPRVFEYANASASLVARQNAIECLNHFALNYVLNDSKYPGLAAFAPRYMEVLGVLANDTDTVVLKHVCKGFVCVIENYWSCLNLQSSQVVLRYMLKACQHPEYAVRLEALEVWTPCTNSPDMMQLLRPLLSELIPVLLQNMVYSDADYCGMEASKIDDDNAAVPDQQHDIKPRFGRERDDEDEEGGDSGRSAGAWGAEWTARKAAASSLDHLANAFSHDILDVLLPLIQQKLEDANWEVQESAVLALGAIAFGCMSSLEQFLPKVFELLLRLIRGPKPLLRSISCWCSSRYSSWICHESNPHREQILKLVLGALLERVLDRNKAVQEAACSAFATLEEEARHQLVPYLPDIVNTLVKAFQYYQAKNLLILYDAVGTLATSVGHALEEPQYVNAIVTPLMARFAAVQDTDRSLIALFECFSNLTQNIGHSLLPIIPQLVDRCVRLIMEGSRRAQLWQQNPNEYEKPDREVMAASINLLAGIVEGLQDRVKEVLAHQNFILVLPEVLKDTALNVKQGAFALLGDSAKHCIEFVVPCLPQLLPMVAKSLRENISATVSNNAAWAIGEVCVRVGPDYLAASVDEIVSPLSNILVRSKGQQTLYTNVGITLGRLGLTVGHLMGKHFQEFAPRWCVVMRGARMDVDKITAFQGFCNMIKANPQACLTCVPELAGAIGSMVPAPQQLAPTLSEILIGYKQQLGANWSGVYNQFPDDLKKRLHFMYGLTP